MSLGTFACLGRSKARLEVLGQQRPPSLAASPTATLGGVSSQSRTPLLNPRPASATRCATLRMNRAQRMPICKAVVLPISRERSNCGPFKRIPPRVRYGGARTGALLEAAPSSPGFALLAHLDCDRQQVLRARLVPPLTVGCRAEVAQHFVAHHRMLPARCGQALGDRRVGLALA
jgi:hypothetical protein